jgi:hypothetical protein
MLRHLITLLFFILLVTPAAAESGKGLTQRDLMFALVDGLGWSFGLPDRPEDSDYLRILSGARKFRIEIESNYDPETRIIIEKIFSFGNYSGQGWVRVPNRPTDIPIFFNLPISGEYHIMARLLRAGHVIRVGETTFEADGEEQFVDVDLGSSYLQAGRQQILLTAPPRGGIDFIDIEALPLPAIAPTDGWNLDKPLSFDDLAITAMQILSLHSTLPKSGDDLVLEAEDFPLPKQTKLSSNRHLGAPNQGKWVSVGADPVTFDIGLNIPASGVYDLTVSCVGKTEITGIVETQPFKLSPDRRFTAKEAGGVTLEKGLTPLTFQLPPYCGLDQIVLSPRASSAEDFRRLTGLPLVGTPSPAQFNSFIKLLAAFGISR